MSSDWWHQAADADLCLLGLGSGFGLNSVVKLLGGRGALKWCRLVSGIVLAVAVVIAGGGLGFGLNSVVKLLGGRGAF